MGANIAILSGEPSGDAAGAALAVELHLMAPDVALWGMGSERMALAGVELVQSSSVWGSIGVAEALRVYPDLRFKVYPHIIRHIRRRTPLLVVLIDFGAFNIKVARVCHRLNIPVLYYFPPGSWRRSGKPNPELGRLATCIATPFRWSADKLQSAGANAHFVGHPLLDSTSPAASREQFLAQHGLNHAQPLIGLLPGSRTFEIQYNTPAMIGAVDVVRRTMPNAAAVFAAGSQPAADGIRRAVQSRARMTGSGADGLGAFEANCPAIAINQTYEVMAYADILIVCSGTATLEAAILGCLMVIIYRGSKIMEWEYKLRRVHRLDHIGMPNIILGRRLLPELIQHEATPERIAEWCTTLLTDQGLQADVRAGLDQVRAALGTPGAAKRTAMLALQTAGLERLPGPS